MTNKVNNWLASLLISEKTNKPESQWQKQKLSKIGSTKSMMIWLMFDKKCFKCGEKLTFQAFTIDHIMPRSFYIGNNLKVNQKIENLSCLCKPCNSRKASMLPNEFYSNDELVKLHKIVNSPMDSQTVLMHGDAYAKENPNGKFARLHRNGLYHEPLN